MFGACVAVFAPRTGSEKRATAGEVEKLVESIVGTLGHWLEVVDRWGNSLRSGLDTDIHSSADEDKEGAHVTVTSRARWLGEATGQDCAERSQPSGEL